jgi:hypothetical protein
VSDFCEHGQRTFGFHIRWGVFSLDERLLASQEGLWSMQLVDYSARMGEIRNAYKNLSEKTEGKNQLRRPRRR